MVKEVEGRIEAERGLGRKRILYSLYTLYCTNRRGYASYKDRYAKKTKLHKLQTDTTDTNVKIDIHTDQLKRRGRKQNV
jgi:hypothetical protein